MSTTITARETQAHRVPFYDDELLRGLGSPWKITENERAVIAHYTFGADNDWFVSYYGSQVNVAYGFVRLGDTHTSEWGEIDMSWLEALNFKQKVWIRGREVELTIPVERDPN